MLDVAGVVESDSLAVRGDCAAVGSDVARHVDGSVG